MTVWLLLLCLLVLPWAGAEVLGRRARPLATALTWAPVPPAQHRHTPPDLELWWAEQPDR